MAAGTRNSVKCSATSARAANGKRLVLQESFGFSLTESDCELLEWLRSRSYQIRFVGKQANLFQASDERMYEILRSDGVRRLVPDAQRKRLGL